MKLLLNSGGMLAPTKVIDLLTKLCCELLKSSLLFTLQSSNLRCAKAEESKAPKKGRAEVVEMDDDDDDDDEDEKPEL